MKWGGQKVFPLLCSTSFFISNLSQKLRARRAAKAEVTIAEVAAVCVVLTLSEAPLDVQY